MLLAVVQENAERSALAARNEEGELWHFWSFREYYDECWKFAKSCLHFGLGRFKAVCILGFNSPQWFFANLGAILAGGVGCGIYTTNKADACQYVLERTSANIAVVENGEQLEKILQIWDRLPELTTVVQCHGELGSEDERVYTWEDFLRAGEKVDESEVRRMIGEQRANQCCQVIFTSGTSGHPKGVLLSHDNITNTARRLVAASKSHHEILLSYLPLSHVAAQICDLWASLVAGNTVYFARSDVLKGNLTQTLKSVRPTQFFAVPRVWEKIHQKLNSSTSEEGALRRRIRDLCENIGMKAVEHMAEGIVTRPFGFHLAEKLLFHRVHHALGLDRCKLLVSSAAPLSDDTQKALWRHHVPLMQMYGLSESTGPHVVCLNQLGKFRLQSVGQSLYSSKTKLDESGSGEICLWGRNIMMGYLDAEENTSQVIDSSGWLHTGDVGTFDDDGFLYVTGRIKDLIITAGGENIPPKLIETQVREVLPALSNCVLIGDGRRFLSILITMQCEVDESSGIVTERLNEISRAFCRDCGSDDALTLGPMASGRDAHVTSGIEKRLKQVNLRATSRAQLIRKWVLLPDDFSLKGGEIGPTMKLKRNYVMQKYSDVIDAIYADPQTVTPSDRYVIHSLT